MKRRSLGKYNVLSSKSYLLLSSFFFTRSTTSEEEETFDVATFADPSEREVVVELTEAIQLLEYQMVRALCRFDTLGNSVSAHISGATIAADFKH